MKVLISILIGLLVVGCGKKEKPLEPSQLPAEPPPANSPPKPTDQNTTKAKPVKELTLEEKVLGEYEHKHENGNTYKIVLLDNGIVEEYTNGKKQTEGKWSVVRGEIHTKYNYSGTIFVYIINTDKSIAQIAAIQNGKRFDLPKERQISHKKIK